MGKPYRTLGVRKGPVVFYRPRACRVLDAWQRLLWYKALLRTAQTDSRRSGLLNAGALLIGAVLHLKQGYEYASGRGRFPVGFDEDSACLPIGVLKLPYARLF